MIKLYIPLFILLIGCNDIAGNNNLTTADSISKIDFEPVTFNLIDSTFLINKNIVLNFYYHDSIYQGHPVLIKKGITNLLINMPILLIQSDDAQTPYLIYPEEHIIVQKDNGNKIILSSEGNKVRTNELLFFKQLISQTGILYTVPFDLHPFIAHTSKNIREFEMSENDILKKQKERLVFLDSFIPEHPISPQFVQIAKSIISYAAINERLLLCWRDKRILRRLNRYDLILHHCVDTLEKIGFAQNYMCYKALNNAVSISTSNYIENNIQDIADFKNKFLFIETNFKGAAKGFLLSDIINKAMLENVSIPSGYIEKFNSVCIDRNYQRIIANKIKAKEAKIYPTGSSYLLFDDAKTQKDIRDIISGFKGNLILLDFWASWCSPCRAEMPYSTTLKKYFFGKRIVFLYVSMDENKEDWHTANIEESLDSNSSFLLIGGQNSEFAQVHKIAAIPRYVLIGKDGNIIDTDAPRPSDPKLKVLINKYLN